MDISWQHTREALRNFASVLTCGECGNKPITAHRYTNCGHFFCKKCITTDSRCIKCNTPVQPIEVCPDHMVANLVQYCDVIANIIQEENLWNTSIDMPNMSQVSNVIPRTPSKTKAKRPNFIPRNIGKNIHKRNSKGETQLHLACIKANEEYVRALLAAGANPNIKDHANWTPLQEVVSYGYTNICRLLLEAGASPNVPGVDNKTALHEAAIANRLEEAKMLLQRNANPNVYDQYGKRPIDYCSSKEMREILMDSNVQQNVLDQSIDLNRTLDQSFSTLQSAFVVFPLNLNEENQKQLQKMASKHKVKVSSSLSRPSVTHVIVEANAQNTVNLSYDIMMALLRGCWLLNSDCISLGMDLDDIANLDFEVFEISGAPFPGVPRKARENAQNQNPGLFNRCYFYFALQSKSVYHIDEMRLTKDSLSKLILEGGGNVLSREPDPEDIKDVQELVPFHTAHDPSHPLYKCTHYIIYAPEKDEPRIKYNMPHIKSLPLMWLIECIEKFTLVNPSHLGL